MAYNNIPDHPTVANALQTGYPTNQPELSCRCPICGEEADDYYMHDNEIVGCNNCISRRDAYDVAVEQDEAAREAAQAAVYAAAHER